MYIIYICICILYIYIQLVGSKPHFPIRICSEKSSDMPFSTHWTRATSGAMPLCFGLRKSDA